MDPRDVKVVIKSGDLDTQPAHLLSFKDGPSKSVAALPSRLCLYIYASIRPGNVLQESSSLEALTCSPKGHTVETIFMLCFPRLNNRGTRETGKKLSCFGSFLKESVTQTIQTDNRGKNLSFHTAENEGVW